MLEVKMVIPCTVYKQVRDEYGDVRATSPVSTTCWFRQNDDFQHGSSREDNTAAAMMWFKPSEDVTSGDIVTVESQTFRITQIITAKRLGSAEIQFKKCYLQRHEAFVS